MILQAMTVLKQQQTGFINGFGQDMGWRIAWVVLWKSDKKRIFEKHFAVHLPTGEGKGEKDAIAMPLTTGFDSRVAGFFAQVQSVFSLFAAVLRWHFGQPEGRTCERLRGRERVWQD